MRSAAPSPDESPFEEPSYEYVEKGLGFVDRWHERREFASAPATDYEQVRTTLGLLLSALRSGEQVSQTVEEEFAKGLAALKRLAGKVEA